MMHLDVGDICYKIVYNVKKIENILTLEILEWLNYDIVLY